MFKTQNSIQWFRFWWFLLLCIGSAGKAIKTYLKSKCLKRLNGYWFINIEINISDQNRWVNKKEILSDIVLLFLYESDSLICCEFLGFMVQLWLLKDEKKIKNDILMCFVLIDRMRMVLILLTGILHILDLSWITSDMGNWY